MTQEQPPPEVKFNAALQPEEVSVGAICFLDPKGFPLMLTMGTVAGKLVLEKK